MVTGDLVLVSSGAKFFSGTINIDSVIGGNLDISFTSKNNAGKIEDTSDARLFGNTVDGRDTVSTSRGTVGFDTGLSDEVSTELEGLFSFRIFVDFNSSKGIPTRSGDKTGDIGNSGDVSSASRVLRTSRSVPSGKDIAGSVSIRVETDFLISLGDVSGESGDQINIINVSEIQANSIVASSSSDQSLDPDDVVDEIIRDGDLALVDTDLDNSISTKVNAVLDIFTFINPVDRDLVVIIGSIFQTIIAFRERKGGGVGRRSGGDNG